MSKQINYFRIGVFILVSLALIIGGIVVLGVGSFFTEQYMGETYLNESAQGLDVGSPVKVRGVKVGNIEKIGFVNQKYNGIDTDEHRYVLVEFSLSKTLFGKNVGRAEFTDILKKDIDKGLRIRVAPQGITGTAYLEIDYLDPWRYPTLPIDWEPYNYYIPSAPGTIARMEETFDSMSKTLSNLERAHIEKTINDLDEMLLTMRDTLSGLKTDKLSNEAQGLLSELRDTNRRIGKLIGDPAKGKGKNAKTTDFGKVLADISSATTSIKSLTSTIETSLTAKNGQGEAPLDNLSETIKNIKDASKNLPETMDNLHATSQEMPGTMAGLAKLLHRTYELLSRQQEQIESILRNTDRTAENLRDVTGNARRYPSYLFFGEPPAKTEVNQ